MTRVLAILIVLVSSGVSRGGLLTNFAASYALYQQCTMSAADFDSDTLINGVDYLMWQRGHGQTGLFITPYGDADRSGEVNNVDVGIWKNQYSTNMGISDSVCFKLYLDPQGVISGSVTVIIDVPTPAGQQRLDLGTETGVVDVHPLYTAQLMVANIIPLPNRQRLEAIVQFAAKDPTNPPAGPITLFGFQARDNLPQLGFQGTQTGFDFRPGNSVTVFDTENGETTTFNDGQIADVFPQMRAPVILDVNVQTGAMRMRAVPQSPALISAYEIRSVAGSLNVDEWVSIDDTEGDPPGIGWDEVPDVNPKFLAERNLGGVLALETQPQSLGHPFNVQLGFRDLTFFYRTPQGSMIPGTINYNVTSPADAVPEPGCLGLALVGFVAAVASRRRAA